MIPKQQSAKTLASCAFAATLCVTGLATLPATSGWDRPTDLLRGEFQSAYSDDFAAGLPFQEFATSTVALVKYAVFGQALDGALVGKDDWLFTSEELNTSADFDHHIMRNAGYVAQIAHRLAERGIQLNVVVVPDKAEIYADKLGVPRPDKVSTRRADFLRALSAHNVPALDAAPILKGARQTADVFLKDDTHWTPFGAEQVAISLAARPEFDALELSPAQVETVRSGYVNMNGDLLNFVPTLALRKYGGPPQQQIEQVETTTTTEGGLFGDAPIEVVLVGTSYSAIQSWNFAGFLEDALQTQVLNLATEGQGPFAPMSRFLASEDAQDPNLKAVIWEIPARYVSKEFQQ